MALTFTTQQLTGGVRYTNGCVAFFARARPSRTRRPPPLDGRPATLTRPQRPATTPGSVKIGNWNEDIARTEVAAQDYEARRARGDLVHITKAREKAFLTQAVPHSYSADGTVRFGDTVMLATGLGAGAGAGAAAPAAARYLANLLFSLISPGHARVTAGAEARPQARNTFVLGRSARPRAPGLPDDNVLRYGDCVTLACNPSLVLDLRTRTAGLPWFLHKIGRAHV